MYRVGCIDMLGRVYLYLYECLWCCTMEKHGLKGENRVFFFWFCALERANRLQQSGSMVC